MRHKHLIGRRSEYKIPQAALIYYYGDFAKQSGYRMHASDASESYCALRCER